MLYQSKGTDFLKPTFPLFHSNSITKKRGQFSHPIRQVKISGEFKTHFNPIMQIWLLDNLYLINSSISNTIAEQNPRRTKGLHL